MCVYRRPWLCAFWVFGQHLPLFLDQSGSLLAPCDVIHMRVPFCRSVGAHRLVLPPDRVPDAASWQDHLCAVWCATARAAVL